ncbi:VRR-NUC domain-containing protein [Vreelandella stevensii]|uniref:VRR-NUC domain-containing protein n=1 Tax=Vreelandella stevensii TaxID=502821 RepID=UPI00403AB36D
MSGTSAQACPINDDIESRLAIICSFVCTCEEVPNRGRNGINLKQSCVDRGLQQLNETCDTGIRVQVPYYMGDSPPSPLLVKDDEGQETTEAIPNFGHAINRIRRIKRDRAQGVLLTESEKNRAEGYARGDMRIPDAVVLRDPNGKPEQNNLLGVIEVKFPPDDWGPGQREAYEQIAGENHKLRLLTPERCGCDGPLQTEYAPETQPAIETYRDRLEEKGISWGTIGAGVALVALGGAATYFSGGLGAALGQQAARKGAGMVLGGLGVGAAAAW